MHFPPHQYNLITISNLDELCQYTTHKYRGGWGTRHTILGVPRHSRDGSGRGDTSYYLGVPSVAEMDQA